MMRIASSQWKEDEYPDADEDPNEDQNLKEDENLDADEDPNEDKPFQFAHDQDQGEQTNGKKKEADKTRTTWTKMKMSSKLLSSTCIVQLVLEPDGQTCPSRH